MRAFCFSLVLFICVPASRTCSQVFKNVGLTTGLTNSYFEWELKENSNGPIQKIKSSSRGGLALILGGDLISKKHFAVNASVGWLQKNAILDAAFGTQTGQLIPYEEEFKTSYITINPSIRGKIPLAEVVNFYGLIGIRTDLLVSYLPILESNSIYRLQRNEELKKINYGLNYGIGLEKQFERILLKGEYSALVNLNSIVDAKGPRLDGFGDEGFYLKLNSITAVYSVTIALLLK